MKILLIGITGIFAMTGCCAHVITPVEMTHTSIGATFYRIHLYGKQHQKIPVSFDVLPVREGYANRITDGWDRKLILKIKDDKVITITSYGKDGKPGGEGDDADIFESHWLKKEDGSLWVGDEMWTVKSEIITSWRIKKTSKGSPIIGSGQTPRSIISEGNRPKAGLNPLP